MKILQDFKRRRAIKSYIAKLPRLLARDYGASKTYTPRQVKSTVERSNLDVYFACYAIAMFSSRGEFEHFHLENGESCHYDTMRSEIAHSYFGGNTDFTSGDIAEFRPGHSQGSHHGHHPDGAHHGDHHDIDNHHSGHHDSGGGDGHGGH